jgi:hypothetical protein
MKKTPGNGKDAASSMPGRVLGRVLAEDLRNVSAGEAGWTIVVYRDESGQVNITNREWDHD